MAESKPPPGYIDGKGQKKLVYQYMERLDTNESDRKTSVIVMLASSNGSLRIATAVLQFLVAATRSP